jgi:hypothetical protein
METINQVKKRRRVKSLVYSSSWVDDNKVMQSYKKVKIRQLTNTLLSGIESKDKNLFKNSCLGLMSNKKLYCS